jgi:low affinity Fe/Cu permease
VEQKSTSSELPLLERFSTRVSQWSGSTPAFMIALAVVLAWAITGPIFRFSESWQLVINTATTIATFLMVFLIQRVQNKESRAVQLKLNEVIASLQGASNRLVGAEDLSEEELKTLHERYLKLVDRVRDKRSGPGMKDATSIEETTAAHQARQADAEAKSR